jgi:hypothetical protein
MVIGTHVNGRDDNVPVLHGDVLPSDGTSADFFPPWYNKIILRERDKNPGSYKTQLEKVTLVNMVFSLIKYPIIPFSQTRVKGGAHRQ